MHYLVLGDAMIVVGLGGLLPEGVLDLQVGQPNMSDLPS